MPNLSGLSLSQHQADAAARAGSSFTSSSPGDHFSPPKHHYPLQATSPKASLASPLQHIPPGAIPLPKRSTNGFAADAAASLTSPGGMQTGSSTGSVRSPRQRSMSQIIPPKTLTPFVPRMPELDEERAQPKCLLLENVNESAIEMFRAQGYIVETEKSALGEDELIKRLIAGNYSALGIRSKTKVTSKVIESVKNLIVIGCFCIGTNQVDLLAAARAGIAVFNSPFANSRSVAELVISEIIALSRQLCDRSTEMHQGTWNKVSKNCWEIRGKTLGIVGYGHIGSQLSVLAEAMGMTVRYFDVVPIMPLGSAHQIETLDSLLAMSDFVSLHVPELPETIEMIGAEELAKMKKGAYLINNARGKVIDIPALVESLKSGHLAGAAIDVYPKEPAANGNNFNDDLNSWWSRLAGCSNVILTPHIGGSTEEAQRMIGAEVGGALIRYISFGASLGAVNFPEVSLRPIIRDQIVRLCFTHLNQPGVLKSVNHILGSFNVERQLSDSKGDIAYLMADIAHVSSEDVKDIYDKISVLPASVATRVLY
ncbi:D-3-phosphoglycerate dehydrogenase 2 [Cystobasidiomycetes sp. EMM_F5]